MKHQFLFAVLTAALIFLQSCAKHEIDAPGTSGVLIEVGNYPAYQDSKAIGVADAGKTAWEDSDVLYLIFQTAENPLASRFRITRTSGSFKSFEKYEDGNYTSVTSLTVPGACRAVVYYAPDYTFAETDDLKLNEESVAGLDEFMQWKSGDAYDITAGSTLSVNFQKDYSRIRVAAAGESYTVNLQAANFIPAGYKTSALGTKTIDCVTDANANAFFYGTWVDNTTLQFKAFDKSGNYSTSETMSNRPKSENGKSYAVSCMDTDFTSLAALAATATTTETSFSVKVKNVVVSYVIGQYNHIEDESGAISVYTYKTTAGISEGQRINGSISGKIKLYNGLPQITSIDLSKATITSDGIVPQTEMTIAELLADFDANLSRRILIKGVTVDKGISSGSTSNRTGKISQGSNTLQIYATNSSSIPTLETGLEGNIIVFPTYYKTTKQASFYDINHFVEGGSGEDTPFTRLTVLGCYSATDTDNPVGVVTYEEGADQFSCAKNTSNRTFNFFNIDKGTYTMIDIASTGVSVGSEVSVKVSYNGGAQESHTVTVAKKAGTNAWLEDKTNHVGYVITLQK